MNSQKVCVDIILSSFRGTVQPQIFEKCNHLVGIIVIFLINAVSDAFAHPSAVRWNDEKQKSLNIHQLNARKMLQKLYFSTTAYRNPHLFYYFYKNQLFRVTFRGSWGKVVPGGKAIFYNIHSNISPSIQFHMFPFFREIKAISEM